MRGKVYHDVADSAFYVAPEILQRNYGKDMDAWSAGIIMYILLCGVPPFWAETENGIFDAILKGKIDFESDPWPSISSSEKDLVTKMLNPYPKTRITPEEVLGQVTLKGPGSKKETAILSIGFLCPFCCWRPRIEALGARRCRFGSVTENHNSYLAML